MIKTIDTEVVTFEMCEVYRSASSMHIGLLAAAAPCPDQSKVAASKRKPCVSWSPVTMRENGRPLPPSELSGYVVHWERTGSDGKTLSGRTEIVKDTQYFFPNANRNYSYRFWAVTHDTAGETSVNSTVATWGKQ